MAHPTPVRSLRAIPAVPGPQLFRGVYDIDPAEMPPPPPGARVVLVVDASRKVIGASWVVAEQAADLDTEAWRWLEGRDTAPSPKPSLRLI